MLIHYIQEICNLNCLNGGQCHFTNGIQECICTGGWTGNVCQTYYNPSKNEAFLLALNRIKQIQKYPI